MQMPWKPDQLSLCRWQQRWRATPSSNSRWHFWHRWHRWHLILLKDAQCRELLELLQDLCDQRGVKAVDVDLRLQGSLPRIKLSVLPLCTLGQMGPAFMGTVCNSLHEVVGPVMKPAGSLGAISTKAWTAVEEVHSTPTKT